MIMTKAMKEALEQEYMRGYRAGEDAQMLKEKKEHTHRLEDMFKRGVQLGREEAMAEIDEITIDDLMEVLE